MLADESVLSTEDGLPEHYFSDDPSVASSRQVIDVVLPDLQFELVTDAGVFSFRKLDPGTRVLLENAPPPNTRGDLLDLGCGYGPIAITFAQRFRRRRVWAVDVNERALKLVRDNAALARLGNVEAAAPGEVPAETRFAAIYSNPPIRVGKSELHDILRSWLARLVPDGSAYVVVQRNLGSDSLARWLDGEGYPTSRLLSQHGYRLLEIRPRVTG
jgi:16S rRNA G1207 methylase RsmC